MPTAPAPDLWPSDLFTAPAPPTPIAVLKQQGKALGARTHNFVFGEVETQPDTEGTSFVHSLMLVAPFLRYRKPMLAVEHGTQPYPATVTETDLTRHPATGEYWSHTVNNVQELQERLREFFDIPRTKEILRTVFNLSNDVAPPDGE